MKLFKNFKIFFFAFVLLILFSNIILAQEKEKDFSLLNFSLHYVSCFFSPQNLMIGFDYLYYFGWFGLGGGIDYLNNLKYKDSYLNFFIKIGLGRLFIEGGASYQAKLPSSNYNMIQFEKKWNPYFSLNWDIVLSIVNSGTFNINIYTAMIFTSMEAIEPKLEGNFFQKLIAAILLNGLGIVLNSFKIGFGVSYSFYL
ncbi:MAG: hypothetical protein N3A58_01375 [Spirochaetes bacterium]|nr:hypothetical protein [Spirochaetota bacterium]